MIELNIDEKKNIAGTMLEVLAVEKNLLQDAMVSIEEDQFSESAISYENQINKITEKINYLEQNLGNLI